MTPESLSCPSGLFILELTNFTNKKPKRAKKIKFLFKKIKVIYTIALKEEEEYPFIVFKSVSIAVLYHPHHRRFQTAVAHSPR